LKPFLPLANVLEMTVNRARSHPVWWHSMYPVKRYLCSSPNKGYGQTI
jgi:hypothetical protein